MPQDNGMELDRESRQKALDDIQDEVVELARARFRANPDIDKQDLTLWTKTEFLRRASFLPGRPIDLL